MITQDELKSILHYDAKAGSFTWLISVGGMKLGTAAGSPNSEGYLHISIGGRLHKAHRLAWLYVHGRWPSQQIDHINGVRNDNRLENLREATNGQNKANGRRYRNNSSGYKGVAWDKAEEKWRAYIYQNNKMTHLGYFTSPSEAHAARCVAAKEIHGEFARTQ